MESFGCYRLSPSSERTAIAEVCEGVQLTRGGLAVPVIVHRALEESERCVSLLRNAAAVSVMFEHERIVRVLDFGRENGRTFLVTQKVPGLSLWSLIQSAVASKYELSTAASLVIVSRVLEALECLHCGHTPYVHGNVRSDQVIVGFDGRVLLGGLYRARPADALDPLPEIDSAGVMLRELLCLSDRDPRISQRAIEIVDRATAIHAKDRFATAAGFRAELAPLIAQVNAGSATVAFMMGQLFPDALRAETCSLNIPRAPLSPPPAAPPTLPPRNSYAYVFASFFVLLSVLLLAYAAHDETAARYLRYAIIGQGLGGALTIESVPPGARLFVDGLDTQKTTPVTIANLEANLVHRLRLELEGEEAETSTVSINAGERKKAIVVIKSAMVELEVESEPRGAEVHLNGRPMAFAPAELRVRAGREVTLTVTHAGYRDHQEVFTPARGGVLAKKIVLEKTADLLAAEAAEAALLEQGSKEEVKPKRAKKARGRLKKSRALGRRAASFHQLASF